MLSMLANRTTASEVPNVIKDEIIYLFVVVDIFIMWVD